MTNKEKKQYLKKVVVEYRDYLENNFEDTDFFKDYIINGTLNIIVQSSLRSEYFGAIVVLAMGEIEVEVDTITSTLTGFYGDIEYSSPLKIEVNTAIDTCVLEELNEQGGILEDEEEDYE